MEKSLQGPDQIFGNSTTQPGGGGRDGSGISHTGRLQEERIKEATESRGHECVQMHHVGEGEEGRDWVDGRAHYWGGTRVRNGLVEY